MNKYIPDKSINNVDIRIDSFIELSVAVSISKSKNGIAIIPIFPSEIATTDSHKPYIQFAKELKLDHKRIMRGQPHLYNSNL